MNLDAILHSVIISLPEIVLLAIACLLLVTDLLLKRRRVALIAGLAIAAVVVTAALTLILTQELTAEDCVTGYSRACTDLAYNGMYAADRFAAFFKMILFLATALTMLLSIHYIRLEAEDHGEYFVMMLFALSGMMIMVSATDLISIYVGLELMALAICVLVGYLKHNRRSNESSLKYVILSALSTCLMLYGISLFYGLTGTTRLEGLSAALTGTGSDPAIVLATLFLLAGLGFKIAAVPFHMWVPDVYEGAPTSITAFMSVAPKAAGFAVILRVFLYALAPLTDIWLTLVAVLAVATMAVGSLVALVQTSIKRMLAYSSIAHAGFALLGLVAGGSDGPASVMLYLLIYTFMNLGVFAVVVMMREENFSGEQIEDYSGLSKHHPILALLALLFLFALAGVPPTAGFIAKFYIFVALLDQGYVVLTVLAVLFSVIAAFFYLRIVMLIYMREPRRKPNIFQPLPLRFALAVTGIATLGIGLLPGWAFELVRAVVG